ncbi:2,5-dichloro-2,5-cyclohexadiene-1,4-diol dehydrogenase LinX [subsurface metagenome]
MTMPVEYAAIKGAIINLTKYLASYIGKYNIRVNCISPGGVLANQPESFVRKYSQKVLLGKRMANVDDLTGALLFLLSDGSKYITGQNIIVDGGWSL